MSRKKIAIAAGLLLAAGAAATVAAQGHREWRRGGSDHMGPGMGMGMEHDGGFGRGGWMRGWRDMTATEHDAQTRERFARLDKNSDGVIDASEIEATISERMNERRARFGGRMAERMIRRFDENRDGKVTREEFLNVTKKLFAEMDLNNDGRITDEDLPPMMRGRNALAEGGPGMGRGGFGGGMGDGRGGGMGLLRGADANKDGVITREEAEAQAARMFAQFDRNKDNTIDKADADTLQKEMADYRVKRFIHHFGADKDGKVTREQFDKAAKERFAMRDLNNDGKISRDEMPGHGGWFGRGRGGDDNGPGEGRGRGRMMGPGGQGGEQPGMGMGPGMGGQGGSDRGGPGRN